MQAGRCLNAIRIEVDGDQIECSSGGGKNSSIKANDKGAQVRGRNGRGDKSELQLGIDLQCCERGNGSQVRRRSGNLKPGSVTFASAADAHKCLAQNCGYYIYWHGIADNSAECRSRQARVGNAAAHPLGSGEFAYCRSSVQMRQVKIQPRCF